MMWRYFDQLVHVTSLSTNGRVTLGIIYTYSWALATLHAESLRVVTHFRFFLFLISQMFYNKMVGDETFS